MYNASNLVVASIKNTVKASGLDVGSVSRRWPSCWPDREVPTRSPKNLRRRNALDVPERRQPALRTYQDHAGDGQHQPEVSLPEDLGGALDDARARCGTVQVSTIRPSKQKLASASPRRVVGLVDCKPQGRGHRHVAECWRSLAESNRSLHRERVVKVRSRLL